jgi:hypothetical protein
LGTDYGVYVGQPVKAPFNAIVERIQLNGPDVGNMVILHIPERNVWMRFMHLSKISVAKGQIVSEGQEIGLGGSTGWSTGPHLHLDISKSYSGSFWLDIGNFVDPEMYNWNSGKVEQVPTGAKVYSPFLQNLSYYNGTDYNVEVARIQSYLIDKGHMLKSDLDWNGQTGAGSGWYGKKTSAAVDRFQKAKGIKALPQYFGWWYDKTREAANADLAVN